MFEEQLQYLLERWKKAFGHYGSLKAEAEQAVAGWEWTSGERYSDLPFHFERFAGRGRVLKAAPTSVGNFLQYGFNEQGQIRLHRKYQYRSIRPANILEKVIYHLDSSKDLYSETFYNYFENRIESIEFSVPPHIPLSIQQIYFENDRVVFYDGFKLNGYTPLYGRKGKKPDEIYEWLGYNGRFKTAEEYVYDENGLRTILGYYEVPGIPPTSAQEQFVFNETRKLLRIDRVFEDGQKQAVYRKRNKGQTFQALRKEATQKLVEAIIQRLEAANIQEKVYCLELSYQRVIHHFPPYIIPVPESHRLKIIQFGGPSSLCSIFSPILDNEWFLKIDDTETLEICQILEQEIHAGEKWDTATSILREVAATLTRHDWTNVLNVTPDFVVFALDPEMEGDQIVDILSSSVSKKQIQDWMDKGWLK